MRKGKGHGGATSQTKASNRAPARVDTYAPVSGGRRVTRDATQGTTSKQDRRSHEGVAKGRRPLYGRGELKACENHGVEACCTVCTGATDGRGFPHFSEARGRRVLQQCSRCKGWKTPSDWVHDVKRAYFGCVDCDKVQEP